MRVRILLLTGILAAGFGAILGGLAGRAATPAQHLYLSPTGSDSAACTQPKPCQSLQQALERAKAGTLVELAPGAYPAQELKGTKGTPRVVFRGAPGAKIVGQLKIAAKHLELRNLEIAGWVAAPETDDLTFRNVVHHWFTINGSRIRLLGGEVVPDQIPVPFDYDPSITEGAPGVAPRDILIDGVRFHDWLIPAGTGWHVECLQVGAGERVTIRNSRFERCAVHDIFVRSWGQTNGGRHDLKSFLIENNFFNRTAEGSYAMQFLGDLNPQGCTGNVVRYNTSLQEFNSGDCGIAFVGNLGDKYGSGCHGEYRYNVWFKDGERATRCGATDKGLRGDPGFVNAAAGDLHLKARSPAIDAGDRASFPKADIDAQKRPRGKRPDAGADERR